MPQHPLVGVLDTKELMVRFGLLRMKMGLVQNRAVHNDKIQIDVLVQMRGDARKDDVTNVKQKDD